MDSAGRSSEQSERAATHFIDSSGGSAFETDRTRLRSKHPVDGDTPVVFNDTVFRVDRQGTEFAVLLDQNGFTGIAR